jgi:hypothetical protein
VVLASGGVVDVGVVVAICATEVVTTALVELEDELPFAEVFAPSLPQDVPTAASSSTRRAGRRRRVTVARYL